MFMGCQTTQNVDLLKDELPEASRDVSAEETKNEHISYVCYVGHPDLEAAA